MNGCRWHTRCVCCMHITASGHGQCQGRRSASFITCCWCRHAVPSLQAAERRQAPASAVAPVSKEVLKVLTPPAARASCATPQCPAQLLQLLGRSAHLQSHSSKDGSGGVGGGSSGGSNSGGIVQLRNMKRTKALHFRSGTVLPKLRIIPTIHQLCINECAMHLPALGTPQTVRPLGQSAGQQWQRRGEGNKGWSGRMGPCLQT